MLGKKTSLVVVLMLAIAAVGAILHLQDGATASTNAQLTLADVKVHLNALQNAPFHASARSGGSRVLARREMDTAMTAVTRELAALQADSPPKELGGILGPLNTDYTSLEQIYRMGAWGNAYGREADVLATQAGRSLARVMRLLDAASRAYAERAADAQAKVTTGRSQPSRFSWRRLRSSSFGRPPRTRGRSGSPARTSACSRPAVRRP